MTADPAVEARITVEQRRSDAVLAKSKRVLVEADRLEHMRGSFRRAGGRLNP